MKILIDAHVFDGKFQGSRTYLKGLYSEMIHLKKEWDFYFVAKNIETLKREFGEHHNVHFLPLKSTNKFSRLLIEFPKLIRKHQIDYSHFQYITPLLKVGKYVVTTHDILFEEERFKQFFPKKYRLINGLLFKRSAKQADILVTVSEYSKKKISELYKINLTTIVVTPNAVSISNPTFKKNNYIQENYGCKKYLLYVSRIEPRKNHISILRAYKNLKLQDKGYQLVFIGSKDLPYLEYDQFIAENKELLSENLVTFSNIEFEELKHFYKESQLVVYPSFAEGFGIPPLEGAMFTKKVICSKATAMSEFNFFTYFIDPNNQKEIEETIKKALKDTNTEKLEEIRQTIEKKYTWRKSAEKFIEGFTTSNPHL